MATTYNFQFEQEKRQHVLPAWRNRYITLLTCFDENIKLVFPLLVGSHKISHLASDEITTIFNEKISIMEISETAIRDLCYQMEMNILYNIYVVYKPNPIIQEKLTQKYLHGSHNFCTFAL